MGFACLLVYTVIYYYYKADVHNDIYLTEKAARREGKIYRLGLAIVIIVFVITMLIDVYRNIV
jgi:t-SNARE complex subunit (syntaxin)